MLALLFAVCLQSPVVDQMKSEAQAVRPLIRSTLANQWLDQVAKLPEPKPRTVYRSPDKEFISGQAWQQLEAKKQTDYKAVVLDPEFYYYTKYGTPLAYVRIWDLAAQNGLDSLKGKSYIDYGYGGVGQLRLSALMGASAVGVDVDSLLPALYSEPSDSGSFGAGNVRMVNGFWPGGDNVAKTVGGNYDLFISKNTLKRGYIHPERPANPKYLINLGVSDEQFLRAVFDSLKAGGLFIVYNLSPAQNPPDKEFLPMADGRFPFDRSLAERVGFKVLAIDIDDSKFARAMGLAYGWGTSEDMEKTIFAHYTILRKP